MLDNEIILSVSIDGAAATNHTFRCIERVPGKSSYVNVLYLEGSSALKMQVDVAKKEAKPSGTSYGTRRAEVTYRIVGTITNAAGQEVSVDLIKKSTISNPIGTTSLLYGNVKSLANAFESSTYANRVFLSLEY